MHFLVQSKVSSCFKKQETTEMLNHLDARNINNSTTWEAEIVKLYEVPGKASQR